MSNGTWHFGLKASGSVPFDPTRPVATAMAMTEER
jgi:hypothetical protein